MVVDKEFNWKYVEEFVVEFVVFGIVCQYVFEFGIELIIVVVGVQFVVFVVVSFVYLIFEIGMGIGVSGFWLLVGVLNVIFILIDIEFDYQQYVCIVFVVGNVLVNCIWFIIGCVLGVLLCMNDDVYDLVFVDVDEVLVLDYVEYVLWIVCCGGFVLVFYVLWCGWVFDLVCCDKMVEDFCVLLSMIVELIVVVVFFSIVGDGLFQLVKIVEQF